MSRFHSVIKKRRQECGYTLQELADAVGTTSSYVHEIENNPVKDVGFRMAVKLSIALNVPIAILAAATILDKDELT